MPEITLPNKIAAAQSYGAHIIFSGSTAAEREAVAGKVVAETGARLVPPYDHPDIMLGQGTLGIEFQQQVTELMTTDAEVDGQRKVFRAPVTGRDGAAPGRPGADKEKPGLDAIMAPCGGGGMLSGVALSCEGTGMKVFGAEPSFQGADDGKRGYESGERVTDVKTLTIADGLRSQIGEHPWSVIYERRLVSGMYSVTEDEIKAAMKLVLERFKMFVEPSACVPLAVALFDEDFRAMVEKEAGENGWDLGLVFSGGNVGVDTLVKLFGETA